jgi:hypothetical protein
MTPMDPSLAGWLAERAEVECCDIVTVGRVSGREHRIEIWFGVIGSTMYLISGNGPGADWYRNAIENPSIEIHIGGEARRAVARVVTDDDERRRVGDVMGNKYQWDGDPSIGLTRQAWCYEVPVLAIEEM